VLDILDAALKSPVISHHGRFWQFYNLRLTPRPVQQPWPEIRVAAASPDTYEEMGTMGHAIFVAARTGNLSELGPMVKTYQEAWKAAGHPGKGGVFLRVPVYVADTEEAAREEPRESILHLLRTIGSRLAETANLASARAIEKRGERAAKMQSIEYDEVLRERMIVGTPQGVIDRLTEVKEVLGLDGILAELNPGSLIPHQRVMTALRLLCEDVIPAFK